MSFQPVFFLSANNKKKLKGILKGYPNPYTKPSSSKEGSILNITNHDPKKPSNNQLLKIYPAACRFVIFSNPNSQELYSFYTPYSWSYSIKHKFLLSSILFAPSFVPENHPAPSSHNFLYCQGTSGPPHVVHAKLHNQPNSSVACTLLNHLLTVMLHLYAPPPTRDYSHIAVAKLLVLHNTNCWNCSRQSPLCCDWNTVMGTSLPSHVPLFDPTKLAHHVLDKITLSKTNTEHTKG